MSWVKNIVAVFVGAGLMPTAVVAGDVPAEIDYLLTTMGHSDCIFSRNGKEYDATDAEAHMRTKYRFGKRHASTTEDFIENLASQSSMSKKPYYIACAGDERIESGEWLKKVLIEYRSSQ